MTLECPHCDARLNVPTPPPPDTPVRCGKCKTVFHTPAAAELEPVPDEPAAESPELVPAAEPAGEDGFAFDPDEPPAPRPTTRTSTRVSTKTPAAGGKKFPTLLVAGGLAAVVATAGLAYVLVSGGKPKPVTTNTGTPDPIPKKPKDVGKKEGTQSGGGTIPKIPAEYADLFKDATDHPAPTVLVPTLQKVGKEDLAVSGVAAKAAPAAGAGKMAVNDIKKATTFIKLDAGPVRLGTGSGFVVRADANALLVATNHHVIDPEGAFGPVRITVVFDSGTPTQHAVRGDVVAEDVRADLAILRVPAAGLVVTPIDPDLAVTPTETMAVWICGFPFGSNITDGRDPTVSIGPGSVSSLRPDAAGRLDKIQIDGALNPGNSGGPIVDANGRLVGVAVSTIKGSGIGYAIPAAKLAALMAGRVSAPELIPQGAEDGRAKFRVAAAVSDPSRRIKGVALHVWAGAEPPPAGKDPAGGWKPVPGAERIELTPEASTGAYLGEFRLPASAAGDKPPAVVLQLECTGPDGAVFSPPVAHKLVLAADTRAGDAVPMAAFIKDVAAHAGKVVAVRGRLFSGASVRRGAVFELNVTGDGAKEGPPGGLVFVADRDVATQLSEIPTLQQALPARLTLRVGKPGSAAGQTPARVTRIDFLGSNGRVAMSIPEKDKPDDPLTALNRAPETFAGQTLTVLGLLDPAGGGGLEREPELAVYLLPAVQPPMNLSFVTTPAVAAKVKDKSVLPEASRARFTVRVEDRLTRETVQQVVTVTKIELLGTNSNVLRTIE